MNKIEFFDELSKRVIESFNELHFSEKMDRFGKPLEKNYIPLYDSLAFLANAPDEIDFPFPKIVVSFESFVGYVFESQNIFIYLDFMKNAFRLYVHDKIKNTGIYSKTVKNKSEYYAMYDVLEEYMQILNKIIVLQ